MVATARKWMGVTLVATLLIGVGVGILVDRFLLAPTAFGADVERRRGRHEDHTRKMVDRLESRLDLTAEQVAQLEEVMGKNHDTARTFWADSRAEFEKLRQQFRRDIRALLTDEQQSRFDEMVREYEEKRKRRDDDR